MHVYVHVYMYTCIYNIYIYYIYIYIYLHKFTEYIQKFIYYITELYRLWKLMVYKEGGEAKGTNSLGIFPKIQAIIAIIIYSK